MDIIDINEPQASPAIVDTEFTLSNLSRNVFRAYDIRGVVGESITPALFYWLGRAVATRLKALIRNQIYIGRDVRHTSQALSQALIQGLLDTGIDVFDLGEVSTPVTYFATKATHIDSGLMVTGSHNPIDYNGLKLVIAGKTLAENDITHLYDLIHFKHCAPCHRIGVRHQYDAMTAYQKRIVEDIQLKRKLKVVVDSGNGAAGPIAPNVLKCLGCEVVPLYCEVDGHFPNHHPDPTVLDNLQDLVQAVRFHQADIGLAFDGDADRLGVVTSQGDIIWPDRLMICLSRALLEEVPGSAIVFDVKCTNHLTQAIKQAGGRAVMSPTGHSLVKALMHKEEALLAGEMSGHIFYRHRWYGFDDALYSACRLLEILTSSPQTLDELFMKIPNSINTPELKIAIDESEKFDFMDRFVQHAHFDALELSYIDGVRVEYKQGWGLLRASNTSPYLIARFEADDSHTLADIQAQFKKQIIEIDATLQVPF